MEPMFPAAIVLAGGRSSRMGTSKALLPFEGEPLVRHIVRRLQPLFQEVVVVASPGQSLPPLPLRLVHDEVGNQGPVGGITYGLRAVRGAFAFVTSCDSAFLDIALIQHLCTAVDDYDVVVPRWEERLQPLAAVYRTRVLPLLEAQLITGDLTLVHLFDKAKTLIVSEDEIRRIDPEGWSFFNMNTPADYEAATRRWREIRASSGAAR